MSDDATEPRTIKAISLWQPWASFIAKGLKRHETRHWQTPHRGPIAIHAAKTLDRAGAPEELCHSAFGFDWLHTVPLGAVVAIGQLKACHNAADIAGQVTRADLTAGNFSPRRFAWEITDVRPLITPIPLRGRQTLFNWQPPENLEDLLGPVVDHQEACRRIGWA